MPPCLVERELETRGKLHGAERAKAVVSERLGSRRREARVVRDRPDRRPDRRTRRQRIPRDRVDREVAAVRGLFDRHERVAAHLEALVAAPLLRLAPGKGDVDHDAVGADDLVDREALTDRLHAPERREQPRQRLAGDPEHLHVDVFRLRSSSGRWRPRNRSRTQPPTTSARPPHLGPQRQRSTKRRCTAAHDSIRRVRARARRFGLATRAAGGPYVGPSTKDLDYAAEHGTRKLIPAITLLRDLVAIDSVNPTLVPGARGEADIARRLADELRALGLAVDITEVAPGRPNVVGVLEGRQQRPVADAVRSHRYGRRRRACRSPSAPDIRDGKLFGRGSQDMKGGVAAMVGAARALVESGGLDRGRLVIAAVADEEHSSLGADALVKTWRADAAVVTEPTGLDVAVAHKGFQWIAVETRGRAAHGSRPRDGRDAIMRMGRVLSRLERLEKRLRYGASHDLLGTASLHASIIEGGEELSSYPARASLQFERRTLPGEPADVGLDGDRSRSSTSFGREDAEFEADARMVFGREPYEIDPSSPLPDALIEAATSVGVHHEARRDDLLDGCRDSRLGRHSDGAVRTRRRWSPQHRGIRADRGRVSVSRCIGRARRDRFT